MSKYIVGYTDYEYVINGVFIPKHNYSDAEKAKGKLGYTEIDDSKLAELRKSMCLTVSLILRRSE
jgi:hypothetical protein